MTIVEKIKQRILKFLGIEKLSQNPSDERFTFINSKDEVRNQHLKEYKVWYNGDSDELLNFYTNRQMWGNAKEPIYNRNKEEYFWGISSQENHIKRVHSGIPNAIISTLSNVIGNPLITSKKYQKEIDEILKANNYQTMLNQQQRPLTLVEGWGAYKISFDKSLSKHPIIEYYEAEDVDYVMKKGVLIGVIFKDYYKYHNQEYLLLETRRIDNDNSIIEYELFRQSRDNSVEEVPLSTIPELADLPENGLVIPNFKEILAVPTKYFYDTLNKNYGKSIFTGKIDLFDDLDQSLSQRSQTSRVSTPVEYYPVDAMERDANGKPILPKIYNRQYIKSSALPNGDGEINGQITTTQPELNFEQYNSEQKAILDLILTGVLSPASLGIDLAKKDNADAQREKEKTTIMTRNNVIAMETTIIEKLVKLCLSIQDYIDTGKIKMLDYEVSVKYNEFANPSFESLSKTLLPMFTSQAMSTKMYVDKLYGDSLSDEEKEEEIKWLEEKAQEGNLKESEFEIEDDVSTSKSDMEKEARNGRPAK